MAYTKLHKYGFIFIYNMQQMRCAKINCYFPFEFATANYNGYKVTQTAFIIIENSSDGCADILFCA